MVFKLKLPFFYFFYLWLGKRSLKIVKILKLLKEVFLCLNRSFRQNPFVKALKTMLFYMKMQKRNRKSRRLLSIKNHSRSQYLQKVWVISVRIHPNGFDAWYEILKWFKESKVKDNNNNEQKRIFISVQSCPCGKFLCRQVIDCYSLRRRRVQRCVPRHHRGGLQI